MRGDEEKELFSYLKLELAQEGVVFKFPSYLGCISLFFKFPLQFLFQLFGSYEIGFGGLGS